MLLLVILFASIFTAVASESKMCQECDQNDYNPVCAEGKAYSSLCKLKREICLGNLVLHDWKYGTCTVIREPEEADRGDDHDSRVVFRLFSLR